jgi:hypothetical protein
MLWMITLNVSVHVENVLVVRIKFRKSDKSGTINNGLFKIELSLYAVRTHHKKNQASALDWLKRLRVFIGLNGGHMEHILK